MDGFCAWLRVTALLLGTATDWHCSGIPRLAGRVVSKGTKPKRTGSCTPRLRACVNNEATASDVDGTCAETTPPLPQARCCRVGEVKNTSPTLKSSSSQPSAVCAEVVLSCVASVLVPPESATDFASRDIMNPLQQTNMNRARNSGERKKVADSGRRYK